MEIGTETSIHLCLTVALLLDLKKVKVQEGVLHPEVLHQASKSNADAVKSYVQQCIDVSHDVAYCCLPLVQSALYCMVFLWPFPKNMECGPVDTANLCSVVSAKGTDPKHIV